MVENTPKMMFGASKIDQGMAKKHLLKFLFHDFFSSKKTQKLKNFFIFSVFAIWTLQRCNFVNFGYRWLRSKREDLIVTLASPNVGCISEIKINTIYFVFHSI